MPPAQRLYSMPRRCFWAVLIGVLVAPSIGVAQTSTVRRIGRLDTGAPDTSEERNQAALLRELGWVEGQNLLVERRYAKSKDDLKQLADELVRARVEVIVTGGTAATLAAKHATTTIPIVFRAAGDPVLLGIVTSLARPGGNITGFSLSGPEVSAKQLAILKELVPGIRRIGVLEVSSNPYFNASRPQFEHACRSLGLEPLFGEIAAASEIDGAIASFARQRAQAVILRGDSFVYDHRLAITDAALKRGLPTMAEQPELPRVGGALVAYTVAQAEVEQRAASFINRILRGAKPGDLPVEQPTRFELVINLKTARALGLTIPKDLLLRADEVIQ